MLLPADTSTVIFHRLWEEDRWEINLLKGRWRFAGAPGPAKFGSMLVRFWM